MQPGSKTSKSTLRWLWRQINTARRWLLFTIVLGLAGGLLTVVQAWLIARIVQRTFTQAFTMDSLTPLFIILIVVVALKALTAWAREIFGFKAGAAVRGQVRHDLTAHLVAVGPVGLNPLPAGGLVTNALEQVEALHNFVAHYIPQLALAALLNIPNFSII